ncbi:MAG TPA: hypothetical protein VEV43_05070 [Actinomycetota bacterium]|nr:hypothetical protein [Actinomycetota bacterium]
MDGRKAVAAGLFVLATAGGCSPWGPLFVAGGLGGFASEVRSVGAPETERVPRPKLDEVFRDGRYSFRPAPAAVRRATVRTMEKDPLAETSIQKVVVKAASEASGGTEPLVIGIVWTPAAARSPNGWEDFLTGYTGDGDVELARGRLSGTNVAYADQRAARVVLVDYSTRVTLMIMGPPRDPLTPLKDVARYLLRSR